MTWTARVLLGFAVVGASFLSGSFQHVGAQSAAEAVTIPEPNLQEPETSSEPAVRRARTTDRANSYGR